MSNFDAVRFSRTSWTRSVGKPFFARYFSTTAITLSLALAAPAFANETQSYTYDALGRLISVEYSGGVNNSQAHSLCYDPAGNRTLYKSDGAGTLAACLPAPTPTPTPTNTPPTPVADSVSMACSAIVFANLTANDSDADGDLPLTLTALQRVSGDALASIASASSVEMEGGGSPGTTQYTYTIADSRGATANGSLTITTNYGSMCF